MPDATKIQKRELTASEPMSDTRLAYLKGGLLNASCKTLAADSAWELVLEVERLRADNLVLRGELVKSREALKRHEVNPDVI